MKVINILFAIVILGCSSGSADRPDAFSGFGGYSNYKNYVGCGGINSDNIGDQEVSNQKIPCKVVDNDACIEYSDYILGHFICPRTTKEELEFTLSATCDSVSDGYCCYK